MMFIAAPRVHDAVFKDSLRQTVRQIAAKSRELRSDAVRDNVDYILHFDMEKGRVWHESSDMTAERRKEMEGKSFKLPPSVKIQEVSIVGGDTKTRGEATVRFFRRGYSQPALLYLSQNERVYTIVYYPFSGTAGIYDRMIKVDDKTSEFKISLMVDEARPGGPEARPA
jgi:general secretion pathway protein H